MSNNNNKVYWRGPEELDQTPEFLKNAEKEFAEELPMEEFLGSQSLDQGSTTRRDFLKFVGFSLTAATLAACESPVVKTIPYVNKPEDVTPGVANWYATTYYDGHDFASILVKSREGRPIYIKGNNNGCTAGGTTARVLASVLPLYNTARLQAPMANGKKSDWKAIDKSIKADLDAIIAKGGNIRILSASGNVSPSTWEAINLFTDKVNGKNVAPLAPVTNDSTVVATPVAEMAPAEVPAESNSRVKHVNYDAISYFAIREAHKNAFGTLPGTNMGAIPNYDFSKAKVIVSVAADFLVNWLMPTKFAGEYVTNRKAENDWMSHHFQFESVMTLTGSNADVRVPIKPSQEGMVLAAIYQHLTGKSVASVPADISSNTKAAAEELKANKGASLVVAGANDVHVQTLAAAINFELGNYGKTIDMANHVILHQGNDAEVDALIKEMNEGKVDALFIAGANPAYSLPKSSGFVAALKKVGLTVSFSGYADETATLCKYVCPDHHYLEKWNDFNPMQFCYCLSQPLIRPLHDSRDWQESLFVWAGLAPRTDKDSQVYYDFIRATWKKYGYEMAGGNKQYSSFDDYWNWNVHNSCHMSSAAELAGIAPDAGSIPALEFKADVAAAGKGVGEAKTGTWEVSFYMKSSMGAGDQANNPWLQELPDPITRVTWDNYVTMSPADVKKLKLNSYIRQEAPASVVKIKVEGAGEFTLPVYPSPGQKQGTIGIALGYGRGENGENLGRSAYHVGQYGDYIKDGEKKMTIGKNAFSLTSLAGGVISYNGVATVIPTGEEYPLACTQVHHTIMGRDSVVRETTWNVYKQGKKEDYNPEHTVDYYGEKKSVKEIDLWKAHPIENVGHRWGMTVDLNSCIGCGSCIIACHAENNVPVVGKDEVRRGRDMHWLRIDRYFSSDMSMEKAAEKGIGTISAYGEMEVPADNPEVVFMPMMCQHCNHAPCETVCPVLATTHSKEGLNQMTYNRCIGTRYCANNCPYKVRRFNWFNYQDYKKFQHVNPAADEMSRLVLNPDVTVRSRGVMEKCSMCVQRIQEGKLTAKKEGRKLVDGDATTACAEVCPSGCFTFGDWNDTDSQIRKKSADNRAYQALEEVGVEPNIWYMVKVRNKAGKVEKKAHH